MYKVEAKRNSIYYLHRMDIENDSRLSVYHVIINLLPNDIRPNFISRCRVEKIIKSTYMLRADLL